MRKRERSAMGRKEAGGGEEGGRSGKAQLRFVLAAGEVPNVRPVGGPRGGTGTPRSPQQRHPEAGQVVALRHHTAGWALCQPVPEQLGGRCASHACFVYSPFLFSPLAVKNKRDRKRDRDNYVAPKVPIMHLKPPMGNINNSNK